MQIFLYVMPLQGSLGWVLQLDMESSFSVFLYAQLFLGMTVASAVVRSGRTEWPLGRMCMSL